MPKTLAPVSHPHLLELIRRASLAQAAREELAEQVVNAREIGHTWREIAQAVGMTEHGVAALYRRTAGGPPSG